MSFPRIQAALLLSTVCLALLFGCHSSNTTLEKPFSGYFDFQAEVDRLSELQPLVEKTVVADGNSETRTDTINWKKEFALFLESDINSYRTADRYQVAEVTGEGDMTTVTYTALDDDLPVQVVKQTFKAGVCQQVFIRKAGENALQANWQELYYEPGKSYRIKGHQSVKMAFDSDFEVIGRFVGEKGEAWRAELDLGGQKLPFHFELTRGERPCAYIVNGNERITAPDVTLNGDSIRIDMPVFQSVIRGKFSDDKHISGQWTNYAKGPDYMIPFTAKQGDGPRFAAKASNARFDGKWEVAFSPDTEDEYPAIGVFEQHGSTVTGTFLTETGDYRFLQGVATGDSLFLSCFDGAHAFLFKAGLDANQHLNGQFWSGNHWNETWKGHRNESYSLTDPDSLTYLKNGYDHVSFSFPDLNGNMVSLDDERFKDKVVIVQVIGSWCPNCMDETAFLADLYNKRHKDGLEIVALCFERSEDFNNATKAVHKLRDHYNAGYDFLIAGKASKKIAAEALPMLNCITSFPTAIFIDRDGNVQRIRTGFYGPGTGMYYDEYVENTTALIDELLAAAPASARR